MRLYERRYYPRRRQNLFGLGQATVPAPSPELLQALQTGATPVSNYDQTVQARDRIIFRNQPLEIAFLGTIAPPVTIGDNRGLSSVLLGYIYGPNAGTAKYAALDAFYTQGWQATDLAKEKDILVLLGDYPRPVYPFTIKDLDESFYLISNWLQTGVDNLDAGNVDGAKQALSMAHDNINIAQNKILALRDSGLPFDLIDSFSTFLRGMYDKAAPLQTKIAESDAGAMAALGRGILGFFASNVPAVQRAFSDKYVLLQKKVIELYQLRKADQALMQELLKLPQSDTQTKALAALSEEYNKTNQAIQMMESVASKNGLKMADLFAIPADLAGYEGMGAIVLFPLAAFIVGAIGLTGTTATVVTVILGIIIWILEALLFVWLTKKFWPSASDVDVEKAKSGQMDAASVLFDQYFNELRAKGADPKLAEELAAKRAATMAGLANLEDFKKIAGERTLRILQAGGAPIGKLPSEEAKEKEAGGSPKTSESSPILLLLIGIVILGPIVANLLRKD
jgi:hypothetical protein